MKRKREPSLVKSTGTGSGPPPIPIPTVVALSPEEEMLARVWQKPDLRHLLRKHAQCRIWDFFGLLERDRDPETLTPGVVKCHRQLGKSFTLLLKLVERCLRLPGQRCIFGAPTYEQVAQIAEPNLGIILRSCPELMRPHKIQDTWIWRNPTWPHGSEPSTLRIVGVDYRRGDLLRGPWCDACGLDEARDMLSLRYLLENVLYYQFTRRPYPFLSMISTMPDSLEHDFESFFVPLAMRDGRYLEIPVTENKDWTERDEKMLLGALGSGKDSVSWRREALCEACAEESSLITPEYARHREAIYVLDHPRPDHFYPHVFMDTAWEDNTAIHFGYVDFLSQLLVIERTEVTHYKTTGEIAALIRECEDDLFRFNTLRRNRIADANPQQLQDLHREHDIYFTPAERHDPAATISQLRTLIQAEKLRVLQKSADPLDYQLRSGQWNTKRSDFLRTPKMGHWDAGMALAYGAKRAWWQHNPYPETTVLAFDSYVPPPAPPVNSQAHVFLNLLKRPRQ